MTLPDELLKTDVLGRVRVKKTRREARLDEFERGRTSTQVFAKMVGVKYQTFASWGQKRRRVRKQYPPAAKALPPTPAASGALRLVEATIEGNADRAAVAVSDEGLCVHLSGGVRVVVADLRHHYNPSRPHGKLGYQSPVRFAAQNRRPSSFVEAGQNNPPYLPTFL